MTDKRGRENKSGLTNPEVMQWGTAIRYLSGIRAQADMMDRMGSVNAGYGRGNQLILTETEANTIRSIINDALVRITGKTYEERNKYTGE